jgi:hypothetical protein
MQSAARLELTAPPAAFSRHHSSLLPLSSSTASRAPDWWKFTLSRVDGTASAQTPFEGRTAGALGPNLSGCRTGLASALPTRTCSPAPCAVGGIASLVPVDKCPEPLHLKLIGALDAPGLAMRVSRRAWRTSSLRRFARTQETPCWRSLRYRSQLPALGLMRRGRDAALGRPHRRTPLGQLHPPRAGMHCLLTTSGGAGSCPSAGGRAGALTPAGPG